MQDDDCEETSEDKSILCQEAVSSPFLIKGQGVSNARSQLLRNHRHKHLTTKATKQTD
jgi:hypothetical protein